MNSIREGWLSLGNRLGPSFEKVVPDIFICSQCKQPITYGTKRYKSKITSDAINLCHTCFQSIPHIIQTNYFVLDNLIDDQVIFHDWFMCDECEQYPICGTRFSHREQEYDLCESMCILL